MRIQYLLIFLYSSLLFAQTEWIESSLSIPQEINCFSEDDSQNIYLSTATGLFKFDGTDWTKICNPPPYPLVQFHITTNNTVLASTQGKMYRSTDFGQNWDSTGYYCRQIVSRNDTCLVNTGLNIIYSYDDGMNWNYSADLDLTGIRLLTMGPSGEIYITGYDIMISAYSGIFRSLDFGQTFQQKGLFYELLPRTIVVNSEGVVYASEFISYDRGDNWEVYFNEEEVQGDFLIDDQDNLYQTRSNEGVLFYSEQDSIWETIFTIPPNQTISASFIDSKNYFYIGTDSSNVYRSKEPSPTNISKNEQQIPNTFHLSQNYPNPFNSSTIIPYQLKKYSNIKLSFHDLNGQEVWTISKDNQYPGLYSVRFDASDLASGVYYYQLKTDTFIESRKMVLLR